MNKSTNYSDDKSSSENSNSDDKYSVTGESEFSRDSTIPFDQDEVLSERHYHMGDKYFKKRSHNVPYEKSASDHFGKGPKGYARTDDRIKEDVSEALFRSTEVDASDIEVSVSNGHVTLKGTVTSRGQKRMAEDTIEYLTGVVDVRNELYLIQIEEGSSSSSRKGGLIRNQTGMN